MARLPKRALWMPLWMACAGAAAGTAGAQPLSAIDWLSDSVALEPAALPAPAQSSDIAKSALPEDVTVAPLGRPQPDSVGLDPAAAHGLPKTLWGVSSSEDLARLIKQDAAHALPAVRELRRALMLAELDPPAASDGRSLFLARVDALLGLGDLDDASRLLVKAGPADPEFFRRWFDAALLRGTENRGCAKMRELPEITPTYAARIFCLARGGDWPAAALTLQSAEALGILSDEEDALLGRFLDPAIAEEAGPIEPPRHPTPLVFAMFEAIGEPIPTATLPLAFAHADLRPQTGWKARIAAGERLARAGAIPAARLMTIYGERRPAASGEPWGRVGAVQALLAALGSETTGEDAAGAEAEAEANRAAQRKAVAQALPPAWEAMQAAGLEQPLAEALGARLAELKLAGRPGEIARDLGLLSDAYETVAAPSGPIAPAQVEPLLEIARGTYADTGASDPRLAAIARGFTAEAPPQRLARLVEGDRLGEAILRAAGLMEEGRAGDLAALTDALSLFRSVGLEDTARRAALQLMILGPRG